MRQISSQGDVVGRRAHSFCAPRGILKTAAISDELGEVALTEDSDSDTSPSSGEVRRSKSLDTTDLEPVLQAPTTLVAATNTAQAAEEDDDGVFF